MLALPGREGEQGEVLEGVFRAGEDADAHGAVIAPPHPLMGGSMDNPVVSEIGFACAKAGLASLRFNWRGVGASAGRASGDPQDALVDYCAALDDLEQTVPPPLIAAGYSFGAAAAIAASDRTSVRSLVLVAPPPSMLDRATALVGFEREVFIAVGDRDPYADHLELAALADQVPKGHFELIPDCDHFFMTGLSALGRNLVDWW